MDEYPKAIHSAFEAAKKELEKMNIQDICNRTGATYDEKNEQYLVPFFCSDATISSENYAMTWIRPVVFMHHIMILHYLIYADGSKPKGELISLHDVAPVGSNWASQMLQANIPPLTKTFSDDLNKFFVSAEKLGGVKVSDNTANIFILPHIPVQITIWPKDDEFPADARILFDKTPFIGNCMQRTLYVLQMLLCRH